MVISLMMHHVFLERAIELTSRHAISAKCCQVKLGRTGCLTCLKVEDSTTLKLKPGG